MDLHVGVKLMLLGKGSPAQIAQVRTDACVHSTQVSAQHLAQQEAPSALPALKATLATVRQHVTRQLATTGALARTDVADKLLLLVHGVHVVLVSRIRLEHGPAERALHRALLPHRTWSSRGRRGALLFLR